MMWAASYRDWIWNDYGWFGIFSTGIAAALAASAALALAGVAFRLFRTIARDSRAVKPAVELPLKMYENEDFSGKTIRMDGGHFVNCTFRKCTVRYDGGPFKLSHSHFRHGEDGVTFTTLNRAIVNVMPILQAVGLIRQDAKGTFIEVDPKDLNFER